MGFDEHRAPAVDGDGKQYEIFMPAPDTGETESFTPSLAKPIVYPHIGVSAADDKTHTTDDPKWDAGDLGGRFGNEGRVGAPAKIFRVLRELPRPPEPPPDSERVFATPADYHGHSFYTYRWQHRDNLKTHIFRALDDTVFKIDWKRRQALPEDIDISADDQEYFPVEWRDPEPPAQPDPGMVAKREQIANDLNLLNTFSNDEEGKSQALAYYRGLSNDALRVLAGLPGNERAFMQITIQPLDPEEPDPEDPTELRWRNRRGPADPDDFEVGDPENPLASETLRIYIDTLDGRSTNRYFYRVVYVDGAHNRSKLSLSSPPVCPPNIIPPSQPRLIKVLGGDRQVKLSWGANHEANMHRYFLYRTEDKSNGRDIRLMGEPVADLPAVPLVVKDGEVDLGGNTDIVTAERVYAAEGFDPSKDLLSDQSAQQFLAAPTAPVGTKVNGLTAPDGTAVVVVYHDSHRGLQYTPWGNSPRVWTDQGLVGAHNYYYRVVATREGETASGNVVLHSRPSDLGAGRAVDLKPPDPPTWTRAEWIRIDPNGNEFPFSEPIPPGETREPAIALVWESSEPDLAPLIQERSDGEALFNNMTDWLPDGMNSYIVRGLWPHIRYRFRLYVLSRAGNRNDKFKIIRVEPIVIA